MGASGSDAVLGTYAQAREKTATAVATIMADGPEEDIRAALGAALDLDTKYDMGTGCSATTAIRRLGRGWVTHLRRAAGAHPPCNAAGVLCGIPDPRLATWEVPKDEEEMATARASSATSVSVSVSTPTSTSVAQATAAAFYTTAPAAAKGVATEDAAAAIVEALLRALPGLEHVEVLPGEVFRCGGDTGAGAVAVSGSGSGFWTGPAYVQVSLDGALATHDGTGFPVELKSLAVPWHGTPPKVADAYVLQCLMQAMVVGAPATVLGITYVHDPGAAGRVMAEVGVSAYVVAKVNATEATRARAWEAHLAGSGATNPDIRPHCGQVFTVTRTRESDRLLQEYASEMGRLAAESVGFRYRPGTLAAIDLDTAPTEPQTYASTFAAYVAWKAGSAWDMRAARVVAECISPGLTSEVEKALRAGPGLVARLPRAVDHGTTCVAAART